MNTALRCRRLKVECVTERRISMMKDNEIIACCILLLMTNLCMLSLFLALNYAKFCDVLIFFVVLPYIMTKQ